MTIKEKTLRSAEKANFTLYKEGLFYKCYNEDAMIFVQSVKNYKVNSKFIKSANEIVYNVGFPVSEVEKGNLSLSFISDRICATSIEENEKYIVFSLPKEVLKQGYIGWKSSIKTENKLEESPAVYLRSSNYEGIISEIKQYDLANTTPMQSFGFIQRLKEKVVQIEEESSK